MALVIIDFDGTIIKGNTHNELVEKVGNPNNRKAAWELVKSIEPIGGAAAWLKIFHQLMADGHQIAIASFNSFGYIIPKYLHEVIGLSPEELGKIHIESWLPPESDTANKNQHIKNIMIIFEFKEPTNKKIIVCDDQNRHLVAANRMGCTTITADAEANHLFQIQLYSKLYQKASYGALIGGYSGTRYKSDSKTRSRFSSDLEPVEPSSSCIIL